MSENPMDESRPIEPVKPIAEPPAEMLRRLPLLVKKLWLISLLKCQFQRLVL
jgi:hypothetical protein